MPRHATRWVVICAGLLLLGAAGLAVAGCLMLSGPRYAGPRSDHFDGSLFFNPEPGDTGSFADVLGWALSRSPGRWESRTMSRPRASPPARVEQGRVRVTFVNHATVLLQADEVNLITDPIWSERASPFPWAGPRRHVEPGLPLEALPAIDVVLLSHNHYDHLDLPTLARLEEAHHPLFVVPLGNRPLLLEAGIGNVVELDWWQATRPRGGLEITCVPARHFSGRGFGDRNATLWAGYVVGAAAGRVYFAGDTGFGRHFAQIRQHSGPLLLALLPIGVFRPEWFMSTVHQSPAEAVQAHEILDPHTSLAIHHGTFRLAEDGQHEPAALLREELRAHSIAPGRFLVLEPGQAIELGTALVPSAHTTD